MSERDRVGIGTFQPKDEKNQTQLIIDINYRRLEFGLIQTREHSTLMGNSTLQTEFDRICRGSKTGCRLPLRPTNCESRYKIKPKKFAQTDIDLIIIGHTNEPEYKNFKTMSLWKPVRQNCKNRCALHHQTRPWSQNLWKDYNPRTVRTSTSHPTQFKWHDVGYSPRLEEPKKQIYRWFKN